MIHREIKKLLEYFGKYIECEIIDAVRQGDLDRIDDIIDIVDDKEQVCGFIGAVAISINEKEVIDYLKHKYYMYL